jgi:hypothetical protein
MQMMAGQSSSKANEPPLLSPLQNALSGLSHAVNALHSELDVAEKKFEPVLHPAPPSKGQTETPQHPVATIAEIHFLTCAIETARERLGSLVDRAAV